MADISARDLARMAAAQKAFMPGRATVKRKTFVRNAAGDHTPTVTIVYTDLPLVDTPRVLRQIAERDVGEKVQGGVRWEIVLPLGTVIELDDEVHVTNAETGLVNVYLVTANLGYEAYATALTINAVLAK